MAVITTYGLTQIDTRRPTGYDVSINLDGFTPVNNSPPIVPVSRTLDGFATVSSTLPISEIAQSITTYRMPTFLDDYYYRVHVRPSGVSLGNLLSVQVRTVEVWNAHFTPQLLSSIGETGVDGLTLTAPADPPTSFAALESRDYTLTIDINGAPVINALYTFNFALDAPTLSVTGQRVVVWPFMPQTTHSEKMEWNTDVIPSFNTEQRLALRRAPRQSFSYTFHMGTTQFSRAKAIATQWSHRVYGIPVWSELAHVGALSAGATLIAVDTTTSDYRDNDVALVWESDTNYVAVEISTVAAGQINLKLPLEASYTNAYVAPIRFSRTRNGMEFNRGANQLIITRGTFEVTQNKDIGAGIGLPQYRSKDVLIDRTVLVEDITEKIARTVDEFDNGSGPISVDATSNWVRFTQIITFRPLTRAARWTARKWIHSRRGRQKAFWLPSWNPDLTLLEDFGDSSSSLTCAPISYSLFYGVKDIMIVLKNGTRIFSRILSAATDVSGNELMTLESPTGVAATVADVDFICFLSHVRFDTDTVDVSHGYAGNASMSIPVIEVPE